MTTGSKRSPDLTSHRAGSAEPERDGDAAPERRGSHVEVERKLEVDEAYSIPPLHDLPGIASLSQPREHALVATYVDTEDLRLARARTTLRRRTGGADDGWHLKLPLADGARREEHRDLGDIGDIGDAGDRGDGRDLEEVPSDLAALVRDVVRDVPLRPVARLRTRRRVWDLRDAAGSVLAELADDRVEAEDLLTGTRRAWRELEVELVDGDEAVLDAAVERLLSAGARPAAHASKLARALGEPTTARGDSTRGLDEPTLDGDGAATAAHAASAAAGRTASASARPRRPSPRALRKGTAGEVLMAYVAAQVQELHEQERLVRLDGDDAVHRMRVAARRLRSVLVAYRRLLDAAVTDPLRGELQWLATSLGGSRDAEVLHARLRAELDAQPVELVLGPVRARVDIDLDDAARRGKAEALAALDDERHDRLLDALDALLADPPLRAEASAPARKVLPRLLRTELRRVRARAAAADHAVAERATAGRATADPAGADHAGAHGAGARDAMAAGATNVDAALHDVRKAAKRMRYTAESAEPVLGSAAEHVAAAAQRVQEVLGEHHDSVVARDQLRRLGVQAHVSGENGFTFGRLHALEERRGEEAVAAYRTARAALDKKRLRRALR